MNSIVLIVDEKDRPIKLMDKLLAHQTGDLHRAFSVFLFNSKNEFILQRRAFDKYHAGGLWTNTCCSHPITEDGLISEAQMRLKFEMGIDSVNLSKGFPMTYRAEFENGLIEHEYDHILYGFTDVIPQINKEEVHEWQALSFEALHDKISKNPNNFTPWFQLAYERIFSIAVLGEDVLESK